MHRNFDDTVHELHQLGVLLLGLEKLNVLVPKNMRHKVQSNTLCSTLKQSIESSKSKKKRKKKNWLGSISFDRNPEGCCFRMEYTPDAHAYQRLSARPSNDMENGFFDGFRLQKQCVEHIGLCTRRVPQKFDHNPPLKGTILHFQILSSSSLLSENDPSGCVAWIPWQGIFCFLLWWELRSTFSYGKH